MTILPTITCEWINKITVKRMKRKREKHLVEQIKKHHLYIDGNKPDICMQFAIGAIRDANMELAELIIELVNMNYPEYSKRFLEAYPEDMELYIEYLYTK